jgi:hypothetical protein
MVAARTRHSHRNSARDPIKGLETQESFLRGRGFLQAGFDIADGVAGEPLAEAAKRAGLDRIPCRLGGLTLHSFIATFPVKPQGYLHDSVQ